MAENWRLFQAAAPLNTARRDCFNSENQVPQSGNHILINLKITLNLRNKSAWSPDEGNFKLEIVC